MSSSLNRQMPAEIEGRDRRAAERRMSAARLPVVKTLEGFDFSDPSQPF
jgi:DNA replication protein DnaC